MNPGTKIGGYEVVALIGAGGMGEVYRARDTKLKRDVALKVLPDAFARDAERMARFQREAEVLASLNHPNIAAIYGLAEADGVRALVMELVEGESPKGPMAFDDAWKVCGQIAAVTRTAAFSPGRGLCGSDTQEWKVADQRRRHAAHHPRGLRLHDLDWQAARAAAAMAAGVQAHSRESRRDDRQQGA